LYNISNGNLFKHIRSKYCNRALETALSISQLHQADKKVAKKQQKKRQKIRYLK
jgi:hypothetical protein